MKTYVSKKKQKKLENKTFRNTDDVKVTCFSFQWKCFFFCKYHELFSQYYKMFLFFLLKKYRCDFFIWQQINENLTQFSKHFYFHSIFLFLTVNGEAPNDQSGSSVSLNRDGTVVAIGAHYNDHNGSNSGHVRIYQWLNHVWTQMGQDSKSLCRVSL